MNCGIKISMIDYQVSQVIHLSLLNFQFISDKSGIYSTIINFAVNKKCNREYYKHNGGYTLNAINNLIKIK